MGRDPQTNKRNESATDGLLGNLRGNISDLQSSVSSFGAEAHTRANILNTFVEDVVARKAAEVRALTQDLEQVGFRALALRRAPTHVSSARGGTWWCVFQGCGPFHGQLRRPPPPLSPPDPFFHPLPVVCACPPPRSWLM